jgi:uncharacterized protein YndB with AHSA1/START domain
VAETTSSSAAGQARQELILTRVFGAPRSLVFKAWTDTEHMARWWGPRGFTNPVCELDVRPGGLMRIDMRGPNGTIYPMKGVFHEIVEPDRLVFTSTALEDEQGKALLEILNTVTFEDFNGLTKLTLHARLLTKDFQLTPQVAAALSGMEQGWSESLYRLADELENSPRFASPDHEIVITRLIEAPRALVFDAWTKPEHIGKWWGPRGFTTTTNSMDVRPGGEWRFIMHGPDGTDYKNRIVYVEVVKPERLVYNHSGEEDDEDEKFQTTVTFLDPGGTTEVIMRALFPTAAARKFVLKNTEQSKVENRLSSALPNLSAWPELRTERPMFLRPSLPHGSQELLLVGAHLPDQGLVAGLFMARRPQDHLRKHGSKINALGCQRVNHLSPIGAISLRLDDSVGFQPAQAVRQNIGGDFFIRVQKFVKRLVAAEHHVAEDQERPPVPQHFDRSVQRAARAAVRRLVHFWHGLT